MRGVVMSVSRAWLASLLLAGCQRAQPEVEPAPVVEDSPAVELPSPRVDSPTPEDPPAVEGSPAAAQRCPIKSAPITQDKAGNVFVNVRVSDKDYSFLVDYHSTLSSYDDEALEPAMSACRADFYVADSIKAIGDYKCSDSFDFLGPWGQVVLSRGHGIMGDGIIGTDFLLSAPYRIDLKAKKMYKSSCRYDAPDFSIFGDGDSASDYVLIKSTESFVVGSRTLIKTPILNGVVSGVAAEIHLDTGLSGAVLAAASTRPDASSNMVLMNEALFTRVMGAGLDASAHSSVNFSTCKRGVVDVVEVFALADDLDLQLGSSAGVQLPLRGVRYIGVKKMSPASRSCGGIATISAPAVQVGTLLYDRFASIIFDPMRGAVSFKPSSAAGRKESYHPSHL